jgi:hypothetical protein
MDKPNEVWPVVLCIEEDANRAYSFVQLLKSVRLHAKIVRSLSDAERALRVMMPEAVVIRDHLRVRPTHVAKLAELLRVDAPIFLLAHRSCSRWRRLRPKGVEILLENSESRVGCALAEILYRGSSRSEKPLNREDSITISALMLSADETLIALTRELAKQMAMEVDTVSQLVQATRRIATRKYQVVLLDWRQEVNAAALMSAVRGSTSNATDVVFAFTGNGDHKTQAMRLGANFIIPPPFTCEAIRPYLRAGYGLMIHELRRYFRTAISIPVELRRRNGAHTVGRTLNLSGGGLAICTSTRLGIGEDLGATFKMPGSTQPASVDAVVCWADNSGRAGLRFSHLLPAVADTLQSWLAARIEERLPKQTPGWPSNTAMSG